MLVQIASTWLSFSSNRIHVFCGMNPTPHARMPMMPNNMSKIKHTNHGCYTFCICCIWVWNLSHLDFVFLFTWSKAFSSFHFYFAWGLFNIHKSVVLSRNTLKTNWCTPRSTQLHLKAMCLVQVFMKQLLGHIKTRVWAMDYSSTIS